MNFGKYQDVLEHAKACLGAEDFAHTYRVLGYALQILETKKKAQADVVILAALLHDLGRAQGETYEHDKRGSEMGFSYLVQKGYAEDLARHVADCILTHSNTSETKPQSLEAQILFDADKLDTIGAIGIARIIGEYAKSNIPMYLLDDSGLLMPGKKDEPASLIKKYKQKLKNRGKTLYTDKAKKIAAKHTVAMAEYFKHIGKEASGNHKKTMELLQNHLF